MLGDAATAHMGDTIKRHIVIAGPGRSGTTLLVKLFADLGFETGGRLRPFSADANAGLEDDLLEPDAPRVVKNPDLTWQLRQFLDSGKVAPDAIEWLIVPLRNLPDAAASRVRVAALARDTAAPGGLVRTRRPKRQRKELAEATYGLFETAGVFELPLIVLEYPRFATDADYAFRRLSPALGDCSKERFSAAWTGVVDPALVRVASVPVPAFADLRFVLLGAWRALRRLLGTYRA